jgi:hypothetical protein
MPEEPPFAEVVRRIRAGDADAARELIRRYEPVVRLQARDRIADPRLGRVFDSMDICQSVMASFFVRAVAGQFALEEPQDLVEIPLTPAKRWIP